jgi:hypothetical protein
LHLYHAYDETITLAIFSSTLRKTHRSPKRITRWPLSLQHRIVADSFGDPAVGITSDSEDVVEIILIKAAGVEIVYQIKVVLVTELRFRDDNEVVSASSALMSSLSIEPSLRVSIIGSTPFLRIFPQPLDWRCKEEVLVQNLKCVGSFGKREKDSETVWKSVVLLLCVQTSGKGLRLSALSMLPIPSL